MKSLITLAAVLVAALIGVTMVTPNGKNGKDYLPPQEGEAIPSAIPSKECPAIPKSEEEYVFSDGEGNVYRHCKVCGIGALIEHNDGVIRCTHCGKQ
jgi:hypothetical protein